MEEIGAPVRRRLDLRELLDSLKSRYYKIEASVATMSATDADKVMKGWLERLGEAAKVVLEGENWGLKGDGESTDSDSSSSEGATARGGQRRE